MTIPIIIVLRNRIYHSNMANWLNLVVKKKLLYSLREIKKLKTKKWILKGDRSLRKMKINRKEDHSPCQFKVDYQSLQIARKKD